MASGHRKVEFDFFQLNNEVFSWHKSQSRWVPGSMWPQTIQCTIYSMVCLPIRRDPILTPWNPEDMGQHLLESFYGVDLPCQCPDQKTKRSNNAKKASPCSFMGWEG